jgi:hypothetical protein
LALTLAEREVISRGVTARQSARSIAKLLGRSPSTVSREMSRNGGCNRYRATVADALLMAVWRRGKPDALMHHSDRGSQGGFKRSSQHSVCQPIEATGQASLRAFSNQASFAAWR